MMLQHHRQLQPDTAQHIQTAYVSNYLTSLSTFVILLGLHAGRAALSSRPGEIQQGQGTVHALATRPLLPSCI
jgi:hypothetical protein